jgi:hypothetical protein
VWFSLTSIHLWKFLELHTVLRFRNVLLESGGEPTNYQRNQGHRTVFVMFLSIFAPNPREMTKKKRKKLSTTLPVGFNSSLESCSIKRETARHFWGFLQLGGLWLIKATLMACNHFYLQSTTISESLECIVFFISFIILRFAFPLVSDLCFWQFTHFVNNNLKGMEQNHHNSGHPSNQPQNWNHTPLTTYFFKVTYIFKVRTHVHVQQLTLQITSTGDSTNTTLSN